MAVLVVSSTLEPALAREKVVLVDDYGTVEHIYINIKDAAFRQVKLDAMTKQMTDAQTALEAYAAAHNLDLSAQLASGTAKRQTLLASASPTKEGTA